MPLHACTASKLPTESAGITALSGKHSPVIVIPDTNRLHESTYGIFDTFSEITPENAPLAERWRVGSTVLEVR